MPGQMTVVVSKNRGSRPPEQDLGLQVAAGLADMPGVAVSVVPHLYDLAPDGPAVRELRAIEGDMIVLSWIYPRAAFWVLDANGVRGRMGRSRLVPEEEVDDRPRARRGGQSPERTLWCLDLRSQREVEAYLEEIARLAGVPYAAERAPAAQERAAGGAARGPEIDERIAPRWYPVIDFSRCTNCLECLNFCLFGVFGLDESESVVVEQADACRHGCPACARICPAGAIIFPQHADPAIAGDGAAAMAGPRLDLLDFFAPGDPQGLAGAERQRAVEEQRRHAAPEAKPPHERPAAKCDLDRLVDEVDDLEM